MTVGLTGDECKEKLGASYPAALRCQYIKEKSTFFFDTEGRITGQASTLTVHHSAFVDYRLVFPRRTLAQADRTHIRVSLRVS